MANTLRQLSLLVLLSAAAAWEEGAQVFSAECTAAAHGSGSPSCSVLPGELPLAQAAGTWQDSIEQNGWGRLLVRTSSSEPGLPAFAAGYLEGYLTAERLAQHYDNTVTNNGYSPPPAGALEFMENTDKWSQMMVRTASPEDPYWKVVAFMSDQLDGLVDGVNAGLAQQQRPGSQELQQQQLKRHFSRMDLYLMNGLSDIDDIIKAVNASHRKDFDAMEAKTLSMYMKLHGHCSSIVKLLADGSELFAGHNSWDNFNFMLRSWKRYEFGSATPISMSSYPGMLASTDDFYQVGHLAIMETTLPNYNNDLYSLIVPEALPFWTRSMVANRLATSGPQWMEVFKRHNSGTYNNMWMVVDYSKFTPHEPLEDGTLTVGEQLPRYFHYEDQTTALSLGYWPSYNAAWYRDTARLIKQDETRKKKGNAFSYQLVERAQIFRRDETSIKSDETMQRMMRYNQFQTDPIAKGDPCNQVACRSDLHPDPTKRKAFGAIDAKYTSWAHNRKGEAMIVNGPSHDDQPAFDWQAAGPLASKPHVGQPSRFNFPWILMASDSSGTPWPTSPSFRASAFGTTGAVAGAAAAAMVGMMLLGVAARRRRPIQQQMSEEDDIGYKKFTGSRATTRCPSAMSPSSSSTFAPSPAESKWSMSWTPSPVKSMAREPSLSP